MPREPAPLDVRPGYGHKTVNANIMRLMRDGFPRPMAARIALNKARQTYFKKHPDGFLPQGLAFQGKRRRIDYLPDGSPSLLPSQYAKNPAPRDAGAQLARYGYSLDDQNRIVTPSGKVPGVVVSVKGARYQVRSGTGAILFSGADLGAFLEKFWFAKPIASNPVPPLAHNAVRQAKKLYSDFTGHDPKNIRKVTQPPPLSTGVAIGPVLGIIYETVRDGVKERYIHKFHKVAARPLLVVSPDGAQMVLLGGAFQFTERGFVDD